MKRLGRSGFTLLELLVVVIIIGILASLAVPQFLGFVDRARESEAVNAISTYLSAELLTQQESGAFVGTAKIATLPVTATTMKYWTNATPVANAGPDLVVAANGLSVTATFVSAENHGNHAAGAVHSVIGTITSTGVRALFADRADGTAGNLIPIG